MNPITIKVNGSSTIGGSKVSSRFVFTFDELAMRKLASNDAKVQCRSGGDKYIIAAGHGGEVYVNFTGSLVDASKPDTDADNLTVSKVYVDMASAKRTIEYNDLIAKSKDEQYSLEERLGFAITASEIR
jgi:hypothetical protein